MKSILLSVAAALCVLLVNAQATTLGMVGYWKMDGNFNDAGPYAIHGSNFGATATTNIASQPNKAMQFLNPSATSTTVVQWGTIPVNSNLNFTGNQDFTIGFYVFANSPFVHTGGFYDNNLNYGGPGVWFWNSGGIKIQFNYKNASINTIAGTFPQGQWVHVVAVRAAGTLKLYINGMLNNTGAEGTLTPVYTYPARLGTMFYQSYPHYNGFNGKMDELRIYNRALTNSEIQQLLPVKITSFTAVNNNYHIKLQWQTQFEQNSKHYIIQRSDDGVNFTDIEKVNAAGNSTTPLAYSYVDALPATLQNNPVVFYRLQLVDLDGRFFNSEIVAVHLNKKDLQLLVFPNPAKDVLQVQTGLGLTGNA
ncbi:MAG: LamG domain-containing protein, partial [Ferruginibacter sp.]